MNIVKKEETVNSAIVSMKILFDLNNGIYFIICSWNDMALTCTFPKGTLNFFHFRK